MRLQRSTYAGQSHDDAQCNEQNDVSTGGNGNKHRSNDRDQDATTEHVLAAIAWCQPATEHLCEQVAVEERTQNVATQLLTPLQLALCTRAQCTPITHQSVQCRWLSTKL